MKKNRYQCKDIPTMPILKLIRDLPDFGAVFGVGGKPIQRPGCPWPGFENSITPAFPQGDETPQKLVAAKMKRLVRQQLVDGCYCGCRGDYTLLTAARELVGTRENPK